MRPLWGTHQGPAAAYGSCDDLADTLAALARQIDDLRAKLAGAGGRVRWTGPAAAAFHEHAGARYEALADLARELDASAAVARSLQCLVAEGAVEQHVAGNNGGGAEANASRDAAKGVSDASREAAR